MRIALLCSDAGIPLGGAKGASVHLRAVATALQRAQHQVTAIVATPGSECCYAPLLARGMELRTLGQPRTERELSWHFGHVRPDLVLERLSLLAPEGAIAAASARVPHIYEVNAPLEEEAARHRRFRHVVEARAAFRRGFAASRGAVAVSDEVAEWVRELAPPGFPVRVESNGAGPEFLTAPDVARVHALEERLRLESGEFRVGFVGHLRPWHDIETVLEAASEVSLTVPTRVLLVGEARRREDLLRCAMEGRAAVTLTGAVPHQDVPAHLALCDAIAVPYASEDAYFSPLKLLEAMAAALPVVASATGPVRRVMTDEHDGLLVPPGDRPAFARALARLAAEPALRRRIGDEARRTVERDYTWDAVTQRVMEFATALKGRREPACRT